ncbi:conserved hypothetical protein [Poseidonocella pacifica]|uniref:Transmembrane protein (Alph_Pro_TM) n=1 Tax=Poseidonocella pacifica TaxID=871651 RepID=A0A1I0Z026_9RHOB|nr:TIGR02186 family protein [Poseidonocella pacifica]SFB17970.1 conserved hypothetical protein [Poseidonocella pacifica]
MVRILLLALCFALPASAAEEVVLGLSRDRVSITAFFDGSEILVFGAVKRDEPIPEERLEVIITVEGPREPLVIRRKERRFGIWVNTESVEVASAPSFYAVASTAPLVVAMSEEEDLRSRVSIYNAIRTVSAAPEGTDTARFIDALVRIRLREGLYQRRPYHVVLDEQTLFRTSVQLPANISEGGYETRIFLTRQGEIVHQFKTVIDVQKVGLERFLFSLSREQPFVYGIMAVGIALVAGWGASAGFALLRR